jgi:prephenate dehydrogenase
MAAVVSHAPYLVAAALAESARLAPMDVGSLAAAGFRDTTRIAASNVEMMRDVLTSNRDEVIDALARFAATLDRLAEQLRASDDNALEASLERIRSWRRDLFERG